MGAYKSEVNQSKQNRPPATPQQQPLASLLAKRQKYNTDHYAKTAMPPAGIYWE
jgi:hypothetical protein